MLFNNQLINRCFVEYNYRKICGKLKKEIISYFRFIMRLAPGLAWAAKKGLHLVIPRDAGPSCVAPHALAPGYRKQPGGLLEFVPLHD